MTILEAIRQALCMFVADPAARLANAYFGKPGRVQSRTVWTVTEVQRIYTRR